MSKKKNKEDLMHKDQQRNEHNIPIEDDELPIETQNKNDDQPDIVSELEQTIVQQDNELRDWKDKYLRCMAEFDNYRRRTNEEKADWIKRATEKLALSICDVLDNFDRALMQVSEEQKEDKFIKGIFMIEQQLTNALTKEGVERIGEPGEQFDPKYHEALTNIPSDYEEGKVAAVIQNGYTMHGKVIRPVRVAVSSGPKDEKESK